MNMPLLPLKLMAQSRRGVTHLLEAQAPVGMFLRIFSMLLHGFSMSPHAVIEPSALRAAKAYAFE
jgi:hypothetical protein